jgi:superoxide dismutase, Fe-Mn family
MTYELPNLPYDEAGLEPFISAETISYHYGKHHAAYVNNLNKLVVGTEFEGMSLDDLVVESSGAVFNNAAQVWNHTFYWNCMIPGGAKIPSPLLDRVLESFESIAVFKKKFAEACMKRFGSGWAWLVLNAEGALEIMSTGNAENPLTQGFTPLLTCDVWEHAYYVDTRNNRAQYVENFWQLVNWDFVASRLA